jgi:hypothetical protein
MAAQQDSLLAYYPLAVGDVWQYVAVGGSGTSIWTVTVLKDTLLDDGNTWKLVRSTESGAGDYFERVDSASGNVYHRGAYSGLLDSLRASPGDIVRSVRLFGSAYQEYLLAEPDTVLGLPTMVRHAAAMITPDVLAYDLAMGFGLTFEEYSSEGGYPWGGWSVARLQYAKIDGREFGTLLSAPAGAPLPAAFRLSQNFPNPFNPATRIAYAVPAEAYVSLAVYDVFGREVARLVGERKPAGEYAATWNAGGSPSGVYFYRLTAGRYAETKKMIILR